MTAAITLDFVAPAAISAATETARVELRSTQRIGRLGWGETSAATSASADA